MLTRTLFVRSLLMVAMLCLASHAVRADSRAERTSQISTFSGDNRNPATASTSDGRMGVVAWDGLDASGQRRIFLREHRDGIWLPPTVVDSNRMGDNASPSVGVDPLGNVHVAWIGRGGGVSRVFLRSRIAGEWLDWGMVDGAPEKSEHSSGVVLRLDAGGRPWLAWEAGGVGNRYSIRAAHVGESGAIQVKDLTIDPLNYNILPEILFLPHPAVVWYAAVDNTFSLTGRVWDEPSGEWKSWQPGDAVASLPAERMPLLFSSGGGRLNAVWRDSTAPAADPDDTLPALERVMFAPLGDDSSLSSPLAVTAEFGVSTVTGSGHGAADVVAWSAESGAAGRQVFVAAREGSGEFEVPATVSDGNRQYYGSPSLAAFDAGALAAWCSSATEGGNGHVFATRVFLNAAE